MKNTICLLFALAGLLTACNFSAGTKKDFGTGLSYSYNGFSVDEVLLVADDSVVMKSNEIPLGGKVAILVQGIGNYDAKDGKVFPGLALHVADKQGNTVLDYPDLFEGSTGYFAEEAAVLRGTITVGNPMKAGETYQVSMRIWDKTNPDKELKADVDIDVK